jgi:hypothetical protein
MTEVTIGAIWLPIVLSAVAVFFASFLAWTVLPHHKADWSGIPGQEELQKLMRTHNVQPGQYAIPYAPDPKDLADSNVKKGFEDGPVGFLYVQESGVPAMGGRIVYMFLFQLVVSLTVGYLASRTLAATTDYMQVFRVTGTIAFLAYGAASVQDMIWFAHSKTQTLKVLVDALAYGLITAGIFGWLWPN